MPRPNIADIRNNLTDFQKVYYWNINWLRKPSGITMSDTDLNLRCLTADLPKRTGETSSLMVRGFEIPDPGIYKTSGTLALQFLETIDNKTRQFLDEWETMCAEKKGLFREISGDIRLVTSNNQEQDNYEYQLLWCFLEDSDTPQLEGSSSDPMQPTITLRYTDFKRRSLI